MIKNNDSIDLILIDQNKEGDAISIRHDTRNSPALFLFKMKRALSISYYGKFKFDRELGSRQIVKIAVSKIMHEIPRGLRNVAFEVLKVIMAPVDKRSVYYIKIPKKHFTKLKDAELYGLKVKIPEFPEEFLEIEYGDWKTPRKKRASGEGWHNHGKWKLIKR